MKKIFSIIGIVLGAALCLFGLAFVNFVIFIVLLLKKFDYLFVGILAEIIMTAFWAFVFNLFRGIFKKNFAIPSPVFLLLVYAPSVIAAAIRLIVTRSLINSDYYSDRFLGAFGEARMAESWLITSLSCAVFGVIFTVVSCKIKKRG